MVLDRVFELVDVNGRQTRDEELEFSRVVDLKEGAWDDGFESGDEGFRLLRNRVLEAMVNDTLNVVELVSVNANCDSVGEGNREWV